MQAGRWILTPVTRLLWMWFKSPESLGKSVWVGWQPLSSTSTMVNVVNKGLKPRPPCWDCSVVRSRRLWLYWTAPRNELKQGAYMHAQRSSSATQQPHVQWKQAQKYSYILHCWIFFFTHFHIWNIFFFFLSALVCCYCWCLFFGTWVFLTQVLCAVLILSTNYIQVIM